MTAPQASPHRPAAGAEGVAPYLPSPRRIRFLRGPAHGLTWTGDLRTGQRIAGPGPWSPRAVYVVTSRTVAAADGTTEYLAVPVVPAEPDRVPRTAPAGP